VISREIEREGIPVAYVTAMVLVGMQTKASRIVRGVAIPHPCGDPSLPPEADRSLRREIVECALKALQTDISEPTLFALNVASSVG